MENNLVIGFKPVLEILEQSPGRVDQVLIRQNMPKNRLDVVLEKCRQGGVRFNLVPEDRLDKLSGGAGRQGIAARLHEVEFMDWPDFLAQALDAPLPLIVALDEVQDPGNVGVLARTLYALGGAGLVVTRHNSALLGAGAARSSAGALFRLPLCRVTNLGRSLEEAGRSGWSSYAADRSEHSESVADADLKLPAILVLGNEDRGIRPGVGGKCDQEIFIPFLREFDSLNVAQAGAILISHFMRALNS